ncbi:MAG: hypothetical protein V1750_06290, partial [Acidobacteriota bacterium]
AEPTALNAADPAPPPPLPVAAAELPAIPARPWRQLAPAAAALLVVGAALAWRAPDLGKGIGVQLRPDEVRSIATAFLRERGVDPAAWRTVVTAREDYLDPKARRFLLENGGIDVVHRFAAELPPWEVRVFRPEEREEWQLAVDDRSKAVVRFRHVLREEAPGATLPVEQARGRAEAALAAAGVDTGALVFKEVKTEKRPARLDHEFTWKDPAKSVGEAEYLLDVGVQGDALDAMERRLKLPEAWERDRDRGTATRYALMAIKILLAAWLAVHGLLLLYRAVRAGTVCWRPAFVLAAGIAVFAAVGAALVSPLAWARYGTAWPEASFRTMTLVSMVIGVLAQAGVAVLALGVIAACFPAARAALAPALRRPVAGSALAATAAAFGAILALEGVASYACSAWPRLFSDAPISVPMYVATAIPWLAGVGGALGAVLLTLALLAAAIHRWTNAPHAWERPVLAVLIVLALMPGGADASAGELATGLIQGAVLFAAGVALLRWMFAGNSVAYLLMACTIAVARVASQLIAQPGDAYSFQGWALLVAGLLAGLAWLYRRPREEVS